MVVLWRIIHSRARHTRTTKPCESRGAVENTVVLTANVTHGNVCMHTTYQILGVYRVNYSCTIFICSLIPSTSATKQHPPKTIFRSTRSARLDRLQNSPCDMFKKTLNKPRKVKHIPVYPGSSVKSLQQPVQPVDPIEDYPIQSVQHGHIHCMDVNAFGQVFAGHRLTETQMRHMRRNLADGQIAAAMQPPSAAKLMRPSIVRVGAQTIKSQPRRQLTRGIWRQDSAREVRLSLVDCSEPDPRQYAHRGVVSGAHTTISFDENVMMRSNRSKPIKRQISDPHQCWDINGRRILPRPSTKQQELEEELFGKRERPIEAPVEIKPEKLIRSIQYDRSTIVEHRSVKGRPTTRRNPPVRGIARKVIVRPHTADSIMIVDSNTSRRELTPNLEFSSDNDSSTGNESDTEAFTETISMSPSAVSVIPQKPKARRDSARSNGTRHNNSNATLYS